MHWDVDFTKIILRLGESLGIDLRAFNDDGSELDISDQEVSLDLAVGGTPVDSASTTPGAGILMKRSTEKNRVFMNIGSERTRHYIPGRLTITLTSPFSQSTETLTIIDSKLKDFV